VEQSTLSGAIPLGGKQSLPATGYSPEEQVHVGLFAGLEDAKLGVDGGQFGDDPIGAWLWTVGRGVPA
jgi:hypothetical protein